MKSIKERSVTNEEMGMFWRETELSWWWYRAPIETQALMIEAFDEVMGDAQAVEDCRVWLLKQKQTQDWKTTKATADAVYALLLRGKDILASDKLVEVTLGGISDAEGGRAESPESKTKPEVGTRHRFLRKEIRRERHQTEAGRNHRQESGLGRRLGQRPLAIPRRHEQGHALRRHAAEAQENALHKNEHQERPGD